MIFEGRIKMLNVTHYLYILHLGDIQIICNEKYVNFDLPYVNTFI